MQLVDTFFINVLPSPKLEQLSRMEQPKDGETTRSKQGGEQQEAKQMQIANEHQSVHWMHYSSCRRTSDTDLRTRMSSGGILPHSPPLTKRSQSKSVISRALAHVEQLEVRSPGTMAQYASVKQAARVWLGMKLPVQGFKFARIDVGAS